MSVNNSHHVDLAMQLLSDLDPELALRWILRETCTSPNTPLPPALFRSLFSLLLRAATRDEAVSARDALNACLALPSQNPGASFGFTPLTTHPKIRSILLDFLQTAARGDPLIPTSHILIFYADAGPGAGDAEEYYTAQCERLQFCKERDPLPQIRENNLAMALSYMAEACSKHPETAAMISDAVSHDRPAFLAPLVDILPRTIDRIAPFVLKGLQQFYTVYFSVQTEVIRRDVITRLSTVYMNMALEKPELLGPYITSIQDAEMKHTACRMVLVQRYKVYDSTTRPHFGLSELLKHFLAVKSDKRRVNAVVPALLTGLIMGWYAIAKEEDFKLYKKVNVRDAIKTLAEAKTRISSTTFGANKRDLIAFDMAIMATNHRILDTNASL